MSHEIKQSFVTKQRLNILVFSEVLSECNLHTIDAIHDNHTHC